MTLANKSYISVSGIEKVPLFIREDYEKFSLFIQKYFEWLESSGKPFNIIDTHDKRIDVDYTDDLSTFFDIYATGIDENISVDSRVFLKTVKQLYISKGSEEAFRYYFRTKYNRSVDFYYPKSDILRTSDGKWQRRFSLRLRFNSEFGKLIGRRIAGKTSGASATVESVSSFFVGTIQITEVFLSSITGNFVANEDVYAKIGNVEIESSIYPVLSDILITDPGTGYTVGEIIQISSPDGVDATARIAGISKSPINAISIIDGGENYQVGDSLSFSRIQDATPAVAIVSSIDISGSITGIKFFSNGINYGSVPVISVISNTGSGAILEVSNSNIGGVKRIDILNFGINYSNASLFDSSVITLDDTELTFDSSAIIDLSDAGDGNAKAIPLIGAVCNYPGTFLNSDGFLSWDKVIQDGNYYQNNSYVLKSGVGIDRYRNEVQTILHPVGMKFFGELQDDITVDSSVDLSVSSYLKKITEQTIFFGQFLSWEHLEESFETFLIESLGPTYRYFDNNKLRFRKEDSSQIVHFFEVEVSNFTTQREWDNSFDFVPDSEFSVIILSPTFDSTSTTIDSTFITFDSTT